jgi:putative membrane-bound dehydrogenase-like protein
MWKWAWVLCLVAAGRVLAADPDPKDPQQRERHEQGAPVALDRAAGAMTLPTGFSATLFAGEPDVHQPIGFCIDHRGRLWVAENDAYPTPQPVGQDRVVVFEDSDGDGRADKRSVFVDGLHYVTGVQIGMGGVWVMDCPNLLFYPVKVGETKPSGPPVVHLDGWSPKGIHNLPNSLMWGPDGWLYGCNGTIFDVAIGAPGTPENQRVKTNRGVWRYHPTKKTFERFVEGTANPWGLDYDQHGQMFMTNNVVAHLWHVVQGGHYPRIWGEDSNKYTYATIQTIADHLHWGGGDWTTSRGGQGAHSVAGGGHSHAGCMLYYGDSFPAKYRGSVFMCNTHGHRINNDVLERKGSGFVAHHGADFMLANDPWFKGVSVQYGLDGSIYFIDWSDTGECHDVDVTDRAHGRIYRVSYNGAKGEAVNLAEESDERLVAMQTWSNEWYVRHARVVLRDRGLTLAARAALRRLIEGNDPLHRLRAMWTLHMCDELDEGTLAKCLGDSDEYVRAWAIQLLAEDNHLEGETLARFAVMAKEDPSAVVRLYLASAMQRTPVEQRRAVVEALVMHGEDADDPNLPMMDWYALEPLVGKDAHVAAALLPKVKLAKVRELIARRMAAK